MSNKFFNWKEIWKIIKEHMFVCAEIIEESKDKIKILIELGKIKDMSKDKVTLTKLYDMMVGFIEETKQNFNQVNDRLDRLEKRVENIEKDVSVLKSDVTVLKSDVSVLKSEAKKHRWNV